MDEKYMSVSKGCFAFAPGGPISKRKKAKLNDERELWHESYREIWAVVETAVVKLNDNIFNRVLVDFEKFMNKVEETPLEEYNDEIPTAIVLAGINLSDHCMLFDSVKDCCHKVAPYVATVWSRDAPNLKHLIENVIFQLMNESVKLQTRDDMKKIQCTFSALCAWHRDVVEIETPLVIILPDYESFLPKVLHDFILTLSSYMNSIKFVLVFGVATTLHVVHRSLTYDATAKLRFEVFRTQSQSKTLTDILEGTLLNPIIPFKLIGQTYGLLIDSFLCDDFSVNQFIQNFKLCMWTHFSENEFASLCCKRENIKEKVSLLPPEKIREILKLPSVKGPSTSKKTVTQCTDLVIQKLEDFHTYFVNFLIVLKCLHKFVVDAPTSLKPLGKEFRELYAIAVENNNICETSKFSAAMELTTYYPKQELLSILDSILDLLKDNESLAETRDLLDNHTQRIKDASTELVDIEISENEKVTRDVKSRSKRFSFLQDLQKNAKKLCKSPFKQAQEELMVFLKEEFFPKYLQSPSSQDLHEIFCYDDLTIKNTMRGSHKALINHSLMNPSFYLKCNCCKSEDTFRKNPDLCILYKLYLEHGKLINLYDWLMQFAETVRGEELDDEDIDPLIQARFDQAVMELGFMGFVKPTQKKTDHVKKLS